MSIAQAALLNLRGQDLEVQPRKAPRHIPHSITGSSSTSSSDFEFVQATTHHRGDASQSQPQQVFQPSRSPAHAPPYHNFAQSQSEIDRDMAALVESLRGGGPYNEGYSGEVDYLARSQAAASAAAAHHVHAQAQAQAQRGMSEMHGMFPGDLPTQTQARNGYTMAEEMILKAHAAAGRGHGRPDPGHRLQPSVPGAYGQQQYNAQAFSPSSPMEHLPPVSAATNHHSAAYHQYDLHFAEAREATSHENYERRSNARQSVEFNQAQTQQMQQQPFHGAGQSQSLYGQSANSHTRSSTLPHPSPQPMNRYNHRDQPQHNRIPQKSNTGTHNNTNSNIRSNILYNSLEGANIFDHGNTNIITRHNDNDSSNMNMIHHKHANTNKNSYDTAPYRRPSAIFTPALSDFDNTSPALVSPALTYSSRTPSTLSPATPFFGGFAHGGETFEAHGARKMRAGSH